MLWKIGMLLDVVASTGHCCHDSSPRVTHKVFSSDLLI